MINNSVLLFVVIRGNDNGYEFGLMVIMYV